MKRALFALAGLPVLCLFTAVALAGDLDTPDLSEQQLLQNSIESTITDPGIIKNKNQCLDPDAAFFKNEFPALTNGTGSGCKTVVLPVGDKNIPMKVCWGPDNAFEFSLGVNEDGSSGDGGAIVRLGVSVDTNDWIYEYKTPVVADKKLNFYSDGTPAGDVAHLDVCVVEVDTIKPTITFEFPQDGGTVSGDEITVEVTAFDLSGLATDEDGNPLVFYNVSDGETTTADVQMSCTTSDNLTYDCSAVWTTLGLTSGTYTITVKATDNAVPDQNTQTASVTVSLAQSLASCFGLIGDEDFDPGNADVYGDGCQITDMLNVQAAPDVNQACLTGNPPPECTVSGYQYEPKDNIESLGCDACLTGYCGTKGLPDTRMDCTGDMVCSGTVDPNTNACVDGAWSCTGDWEPISFAPLQISHVAKDGPEGLVPGMLGGNVFGYKGCFVASRLQRGGLLTDQYTAWPSDPPTGLVWTLTYSLTESLNPDVIIDCNLGEKLTSQGGYQPIDKNESVDTTPTGLQAVVLAATQDCQNPPRTLTRDNGVDVGNVFEFGPGDTVAFKTAQAQKQFDAVEGPALTCAGGDYIKGKVKFSDVTSPINQAKAQFSNGTIPALIRAYEDLQDSACAIRAAKWQVTAENCPGDLLSRVENLAYRMKDLVAAKDPGFDIGSLRESPCLITDPAN